MVGIPSGVTGSDGLDSGPAILLNPIALTVNVYVVPLVNPVKFIDVSTPDVSITLLREPSYAVTLYFTTVLDVGAVQTTLASLSPAVAVTLVGLPMNVGVTGLDGLDGFPSGTLGNPFAFTLKVYVTPLVNPVKSRDVARPVVGLSTPPGVLITM